MNKQDLKDELRSQPSEPLLPIEMTLIRVSLGLGLALLLLLGLLSRGLG